MADDWRWVITNSGVFFLAFASIYTSRTLLRHTFILRRIEAKIDTVQFVQSGQLHGASGEEIIATMRSQVSRWREEEAFERIAEANRPPWWRRLFAHTPKIEEGSATP